MRRLLGVWCIGCVFAAPAIGATPNPQQQQQFKLASGPAAKILVEKEGWHSVTFADLKKAGFPRPRRTSTLQLYVEGKQVRIRVTNSAVEFFGVPLDTLSTKRQTYWLIAGSQRGSRIPSAGGDESGAVATSVAATVVAELREAYFAAVLNKEVDNLFGEVVRPAEDVRRTISVAHLNSKAPATLDVALHGSSAFPHKVRVSVNGTQVGTATFTGLVRSVTRLPVSEGILKEGENVVALRAIGGELDYSLPDSLALTYNRFLVADRDVLDFVLPAGQRARVDGFSSRQVRVMDVTDPTAPVLLRGSVLPSGEKFSVTVGSASRKRHLVTLAEGQALRPAAVLRNRPSTLRAAHRRADLVVVTHGDFTAALAPLLAARKQEGLRVAVADVEDVYDEFGFGAHGPQAIKDFLAWTHTEWALAPRFLLLVGDATYDPRNELGKGDFDFVPTKLVDTVYLETASDDWLADFDNDGVPELSIGRLPVRTAAQAKDVIGKIVRYGSTGSANPSRQMLLVSDSLKDYDFEAASETLYGLIPSTWTTEAINRAQGPNDAAVRSRVLSALNAGPSIVNFFGHGSVGIWTAGSILNVKAASELSNSRLSLFVMMTCLNGFFHDPTFGSLGEALLTNPSGGAVAVWSSTGETVPTDQIAMDQKALSLLFDKPETTLGDAMVQAKASVRDMDVRRTWVLFGDPTMRLH